MKILCTCENIIIDQTDYLKNKGYLISDTKWFNLWDSIDEEIENSANSYGRGEESESIQLRMQNLFRTLWECSNCGKLFINGEDGNLILYTPDNENYNRVLDKRE